jgi:hypothetical protein
MALATASLWSLAGLIHPLAGVVFIMVLSLEAGSVGGEGGAWWSSSLLIMSGGCLRHQERPGLAIH